MVMVMVMVMFDFSSPSICHWLSKVNPQRRVNPLKYVKGMRDGGTDIHWHRRCQVMSVGGHASSLACRAVTVMTTAIERGAVRRNH